MKTVRRPLVLCICSECSKHTHPDQNGMNQPGLLIPYNTRTIHTTRDQRAEIQATLAATNSHASPEEEDFHDADPMQIDTPDDEDQDRHSELDNRMNAEPSGSAEICPITESSESEAANPTYHEDQFDTCE